MSAGTRVPDPADPPAQELSYDESFDLLSNSRRRYALYYLRQNGDTATLGELADWIAARENDVDPDAVTYQERKRVYTSLQQVHLPRMDDLGVVAFDSQSGAVERQPVADNLELYLEVVGDGGVPWGLLYLGLAALNLGVIGLAAAGVFPGVSGLQIAVFVTASFFLTSLVNLYVCRTEMRLDRSDADGSDREP
jgi:hypothetical protein